MKFYLTKEGLTKLKRSFLNLKLYSIIDINEIIYNFGYDYENIDEYGSFMINREITDKINLYLKSKRIRGIIYINPYINETLINNLFDELEKFDKISDIVLLDDYNVPRLKEYYQNFKEVIFFPSIKKIRLTEYQDYTATDNITWNK